MCYEIYDVIPLIFCLTKKYTILSHLLEKNLYYPFTYPLVIKCFQRLYLFINIFFGKGKFQEGTI